MYIKNKILLILSKIGCWTIECDILDISPGSFTFIWATYVEAERLRLFIKLPGPVSETQVVTRVGRIMPQHQEITHASPN